MEKLAFNLDGFRRPADAPVRQAHRTPVRQAHRTPVRQAIRSPVAQATRNTDRNTVETHTETQGVCDEFLFAEIQKKTGLKIEQLKYVLLKQKTTLPELAKAVQILKTSKTQNIMKMLLTCAFYDGVCILEPDRLEYDERLAANVTARQRAAGAQMIAERKLWEARNQRALDNLKWYQDALTDEQRAQVRAYIEQKHPGTQARFASGNFGPAIIAFLGVARTELRLNAN